MGPEGARANLVEDLRRPPFPIDDVEPAKRRGSEYLDVEYMRTTLFSLRRYKHLSEETLALLGLEANPAGYDLFGGYFLSKCRAHIYEYSNLKWVDVEDEEMNKPEEIQDRDNHCWDADKYAFCIEWEPHKTDQRPETETTAENYRAKRGQRIDRELRGAMRQMAKNQGPKQDTFWGD
jgi:hypothetical protein